MSACNVEDLGSIPGSGRSPGEGNTPVFLPGESHGERSLVGYSPRGHKESDTTERLHFLTFTFFDILIAAQGETYAIIKVKCCVYISDLSGNVSAALDNMKNLVKAMSNDNPSFWTLVFSWIKGDW